MPQLLTLIITNNFNPRSPHGERLQRAPGCTTRRSISIHAPRTGSDRRTAERRLGQLYFNPRSPHGERHDLYNDLVALVNISIHAPRTGSDRKR